MIHPGFAAGNLLVLCDGFLTGSHRRGAKSRRHMSH